MTVQVPAVLVQPDWHTARTAARAAVPLPEEDVPVADADGRVLAADASAVTDLPGFDTAAGDGWAVAGLGPWRLVGAAELREGDCSVIATGGVVPPGSTAVVWCGAGTVTDELLSAPQPELGRCIRPRGEECRIGEVLAPAGTTLTPAHLGLLSSAGLDSVAVRRRPRVGLILSGYPGEAVRGSQSPQLAGWLQRLGAEVVLVTGAADTLPAHVSAVSAAVAMCDVVVTSGRLAAVPVDHVRGAVTGLGGTLLVDSVAVRPGRRMALAQLPSRRFLLALPSNPVSAVVSLLSLGQPLLDSMLGRPDPRLSRVVLTAAVAAPATEHRLVPCTVRGTMAAPVVHLGSAMLRGLSEADGFAVVPPGGADAGDEADFLPLPG